MPGLGFLAQFLASLLGTVLQEMLKRRDLKERVRLEGALENARQVEAALRFKEEYNPIARPDVDDFGVQPDNRRISKKLPRRDSDPTDTGQFD